MISAKELVEKDKKRQNIKKELYKAILEQFSRKIKASFDLGSKSTVLIVPSFMIGFPKYDLPTAVKYMGRQLIRLGYRVKLQSPVSYEVSWEKLKPENDPEVIEPEFEFPSLMNLKKTAEKYKR
jgi:hypothetical protein